MSEPSPAEQLLRTIARAETDSGAASAIRQACRAQADWPQVIRLAERHGVAPYLMEQIQRAEAEVPSDALKQLRVLVFRHQSASRIRTAALLEILRELEARDIQVLVLKGAALAHLIYERPGLRPMSDIDILVHPRSLDSASAAVADLGYAGGPVSATPEGHHHLPTVSRSVEGLKVSLEIHHDALAPDNIGSIRLDNLSQPPQSFEIDGQTVHTLGHVDTLRHLCRHALEPRESMKIGSALDILIYASRYAPEIDWPRLRKQFPEVITTLQMLAYLLPWPPSLEGYVSRPAAAAPRGVGVGMIPLSSLRRRQGRAMKLLNPSDWWLRAFYNVPANRSLAWTKTVRHPARVAYWLWRRLGRASR